MNFGMPSFVINADYAEPLLGDGSIYTDNHILGSIIGMITILFQSLCDSISRVCQNVGV
jgi:hypothetical protein